MAKRTVVKDICDTVALLAYSQVLSFKDLEVYRAMPRDERSILPLPFEHHVVLHQMLYDQLGFEYKGEDFLEDIELLKKPGYLNFTYVNSIDKNKIGDKIKEYHGEDAWIIYWFVLYFMNLVLLCSAADKLLKMIEKEKGQIINKNLRNQKNQMIKYFNECIWIFNMKIHLLEYYDDDFLQKIEQVNIFLRRSKKHDLNAMVKISKMIEPLLEKVLPNYINGKTIEKGEYFIKQLRDLRPGIKTWSDYENLCIKILNFLFIPPFRKIYIQVKTVDGYERRDAVIPNNSNTFFWNNIKQEFTSKNIICEFKNLSKGGKKETLNQLRIYLSKSTIGKFGLLFLRQIDNSKSILKAQHDAYEQNGILVLIIDDKILEKLILAKMYFNSCSDVLESEKVRFELSY